jgi:hypothetical protein
MRAWYAVKERDFLEVTLNSHKMKLYLVAGVPESTQFVTQTTKEISRIEWFYVNDLPCSKAAGSSNFFLVMPFVRQLQEWIKWVAVTSRMLAVFFLFIFGFEKLFFLIQLQ